MSKDFILFESYPNFSGSAFEVYIRMLKQGYAKKCCMLWAVDDADMKTELPFPSVPFFNSSRDIQNAILANTHLIIDSNRYINKSCADYRIHLRHGCSFKKCTGYYSTVGTVDAIITTSDAMKAIDERVWPASCKGKFVVTGLPSNDRLFAPTDIYANGFMRELTGTDNRYNKIIGWLPTFRQHRYGDKTINHKYPYGLPLIKSNNDLEQLNSILHDENMLLLVQMHHAQAANYTKPGAYSNIKFVTQSLKAKYNITNGDLMGFFDAMITDYSAAYHEYIILNRPIALTIDDIDEYAKTVGFCYSYTDWIKGHYCTTITHLIDFIASIVNGTDQFITDRTAARDRIHKYVDASSSNRVIQLLHEQGIIK